jgi:hypothetical protein
MYFGQLYHWKLPQVCNKHKTCNLQQLIQHKKKEFVVGCSFFLLDVKPEFVLLALS